MTDKPLTDKAAAPADRKKLQNSFSNHRSSVKQVAVEDSVELDEEKRSPTRTTASLREYIRKVERAVIGLRLGRFLMFKEAQTHYSPALEKGQLNRIMIFCGCFNPPHQGHLELLCHAFLRTDHQTIAVMILPTDSCGMKDHQHVNGMNLMLEKHQRIQLWEDEVLRRFAWVWPGNLTQVKAFREKIQELAEADGFELAFTSLYGADHEKLDGSPGWGKNGTITSDLTRPVDFLNHTSYKMAKPPPLEGWSAWTRTLPASDVFITAESHHCPRWGCWICWKTQKHFPEYFEEDYKENPQRLAGFAGKIVSNCHEGQGVIWRTWNPAEKRWLWFLSSGREYPDDPRRVAISSSRIRELIGTAPDDEVFDKIKDMVLNPARFLRMVGWDTKGGKRKPSPL